MQIIDRKDLPKDHIYYRSSSFEYWSYLEKYFLKTVKIWEKQFWWVKQVFWWLFQISKFERIDEEPNVEEIKKNWFKRWMLIWIPYSRTDIPTWWRKLWLNSHFTTTWFTILENEDYYKKWKERSRRARKKYLTNPHLSIRQVNHDEFQKYYTELKIKQPFKKSFRWYHKDISSFDNRWSIRNIVCFYDDKPIAWLAVFDYDKYSSAHLVAFITKKWKETQAWTWVIDYRFKDSLRLWIKYINFDHLRDKYMTKDQQWYTDFKENFMDYKVVFKESYFKFI